jgi:hypothetical protein
VTNERPNNDDKNICRDPTIASLLKLMHKCGFNSLKRLGKLANKSSLSPRVKYKFKNFNQCPITLGLDTNDDQICSKISIFSSEILQAVSHKGNFKSINTFYSQEDDDCYGQLCLEGGAYLLRQVVQFYMSNSYSENVIGFVVTPTEPYTSYEMLLMPSDELTWIFLIATFGLIFVMKIYAPTWIQNAFFGEGIKSPAFNFLGHFFGIGQVRVPVESCA